MDTDPAERFRALCATFADRPDVTQPVGGRRFGSDALKVGGSIFAMLVSGRLVVKLPAARVAASIADGGGEPFVGARGARMKEWLLVSGDADDATWSALAGEAFTFVGGR